MTTKNQASDKVYSLLTSFIAESKKRWALDDKRWTQNEKDHRKNERDHQKMIKLLNFLDKDIMTDRKRIDTLETKVRKHYSAN